MSRESETRSLADVLADAGRPVTAEGRRRARRQLEDRAATRDPGASARVLELARARAAEITA